MIKSTFIGLLGALTIATPAHARIDSGTGNLLRLIDSKGVKVVEGASCRGNVHGMFVSYPTKELHVCFDGVPDANDHDTVRHEAWHYLQSCRTPPGQPLRAHITNKQQYVDFVTRGTTAGIRDNVFMTYPNHKHKTELEAFAAARLLTSNEIATLIRQTCR